MILVSNLLTPPIPADTLTKEKKINIELIGLLHHIQSTRTITNDQNDLLIQTLDKLKKDIKQDTTYQQAIKIINESINTLHKNTIITNEECKIIHTFLSTIQHINNQPITTKTKTNNNQNTSNYLCLLIGKTTNAHLINTAELTLTGLVYILIATYFFAKFIGIGDNLYTLINTLKDVHNTFQELRPKSLPGLGYLALGTRQRSPSPPNQLKTYPSLGWIKTIGLLGQTDINGSYIGEVRSLKSPLYAYYTYFLGATGFTGINIRQNDGTNFFIGFALQLKTTYWPQPPYP
jgi:hypothetical protein